MGTIETNFDAIPGPTHNYAGLSYGNLASQKYSNQPSSPRQAALQALAKMKFLADLGLSQAVLPPHHRPDLSALRRLGFAGSDAAVLESAGKYPAFLAACGSASAMWAANAATVSPSADTADGRVHFTAANLNAQFHRSLESSTTAAILKAIFRDESAFAHHDPLPPSPHFGDEGAANHTRLANSYDQAGLEIFVYGRRALQWGSPVPARFPARQTAEASEAIARLHQLETRNVLYLQQNPSAIDGGVFHNDVVAVGNLNVMLYHAAAYLDATSSVDRIRGWFAKAGQGPIHLIEVTSAQLPLADAVSSYLFNSQLVQLEDGSMALIAPSESRDNPRAAQFLNELIAKDTPIRDVHYVTVRQSMRNGGGPACMRLRVVLSDEERRKTNPKIFLTDELCESLKQWIGKHYRETLSPADLADPQLQEESRRALDELTQLLELGPIYSFQK